MQNSGVNLSEFAEKSRRVLVVTTETRNPAMNAVQDGEAVIADLAGAGYPFDVVTYRKFTEMPMHNHDIIILNGHTSPTPVKMVALKCQKALRSDHKVFINGNLPYERYDDNCHLIEKLPYCSNLFDVSYSKNWVWGSVLLPKGLEKDPDLTNTKKKVFQHFHTFGLIKSPGMAITIGGYTIGFLNLRGGAIDGSSNYLLNLIDYGKVVSYLRYGNTGIIGFANDRIQGRPIVSFEVHCDISHDTKAIEELERLADDFDLPLMNLLVLDRLTTNSISVWNAAANNPLMEIGSHSRTHPHSWKNVVDFYSESLGALASQKLLIPLTKNYFNFSGLMNPGVQQIDTLHTHGVTCPCKGRGIRAFGVFWSHRGQSVFRRALNKAIKMIFPIKIIQMLPTNSENFAELSKTTDMPFGLSHTLESDYTLWKRKKNYFEETKSNFKKNVKYGLYSFGYIHDYMMNPDNNRYTDGIHMSTMIKLSIEFLKSQGAIFINPYELVHRLIDFITGDIDYKATENGTFQVRVHRASSMANQVKIECRNNMVPIATGESVLSQVRINNLLYVDLKPEKNSTFMVKFKPFKMTS